MRVGHGAVLGLVSSVCCVCWAADPPLGSDPETIADEVWADATRREFHRRYRDRSYILIQPEYGSPTAMFLTDGDADPEPVATISLLDRLLLRLGDPVPEVREEAVLSLLDLDETLAAALLIPSLHDESVDVRLAAEAVAEDLGLEIATDSRSTGRQTQ